MASSVMYRNDYTEPYVYRENVPQGAVPASKETETPAQIRQSSSGSTCTKVMATIALVLAIILAIWLGIITWLVAAGTINTGSSHGESVSNPQVILPSETTTLMNQTETPQSSGSAVYVRWGRTVCPATASLIYKGVAGGKHFSESGSGSNYLCLPETPEYDEYQAGVGTVRAFVYSAEYQISDFPPFEDKNNHDVPCVVCHANDRISMLMIPAKMTCPDDTWTREYHGYLMAERSHVAHHSSDFVCVDRNLEIRPGSIANEDGALFDQVEGRCNKANLPCAPYIDGAELTCVVCTK